jgi:capsular polysaccharide biosynthesis protein
MLGAAIAFGLSVAVPPGYTAHVTILVTPAPRDTGITTSDLQVAQALIPTFAELATTRPVLDRVLSATHVPTDAENLAKSVTTSVPAGTNLLTLNVSSGDATEAAALANAIASELRAYNPPGGGTANAGLTVQLTVVDPATPPITRDGPGLLVRIALGGAIALFLTVSIAFLSENLWPQNRWTTQRAVA